MAAETTHITTTVTSIGITSIKALAVTSGSNILRRIVSNVDRTMARSDYSLID
jgi:hypothetical protein